MEPREKGSKATFVRRYPPQEIPRYATEMVDFMRAQHSDILSDIRDNPKKKLDDDIKTRISAALLDFERVFESETIEAAE